MSTLRRTTISTPAPTTTTKSTLRRAASPRVLKMAIALAQMLLLAVLTIGSSSLSTTRGLLLLSLPFAYSSSLLVAATAYLLSLSLVRGFLAAPLVRLPSLAYLLLLALAAVYWSTFFLFCWRRCAAYWSMNNGPQFSVFLCMCTQEWNAGIAEFLIVSQ